MHLPFSVSFPFLMLRLLLNGDLQVGDKSDRVSFDLRPSDAINIAVRCKVL